MKTLSENWLTEGLIDFEYKKYILLAYLQSAKNAFEEKKLYPIFQDLIFHYDNLLKIKENKMLLYENFPKKISKADFYRLEIIYKKIVEDDDLMNQIESLIMYSLPKFKDILSEGKELYELISSRLEILPVGISPLYPDEGYVFISEHNLPEMRIFRYQITIFENTNEKFRGIHTTHIETLRKKVGQSYENLKIDLIRRFNFMPNPATFAIHSKINCPFEESLFPIAKRALVRYIATAA